MTERQTYNEELCFYSQSGNYQVFGHYQVFTS